MKKYNILQSLFIFFLVFSQFLHTKSKEVIRVQRIIECQNQRYWKRFPLLENYLKEYGLVFVDSRPDVIFCNCVTDKILKQNVPIIILERKASGSLRRSTRKAMVNKQVKAVFKNRVLKDRDLLNITSINDAYHCNIINNYAHLLNLKIPVSTYLSMRDIDKVYCITWTLGNSPFSKKGEILKNIKIDFSKKRPIDVFFAGRVELPEDDNPGSKLYGWHRNQMIKQLKNICGINILTYSSRALSFEDYVATIKQSKIVISPWGWGAWAYRDCEAIHGGAVLVKPDTGFLQAIPDIYQNNITYVPCLPDFSDLEEQIRKILADYDNYKHMRKYAKQILIDSWDMRKLAFDFVQAVKDSLAR